ncbi:XRE family transcriptional regulator [Aquicoccus porphyridii]|uniref:XRE family transcriptional regulator n=1 Tax=Aquicoccus porphyridii TaxID=1852029 RepID=A0A5A9ZT59_9RHOB|nr:XRE family transcriptional regulator [Aquicoccus porphyridii]
MGSLAASAICSTARSIAGFEMGQSSPYPRTIVALRAALESARVELIAENGGGAGVRLRKDT